MNGARTFEFRLAAVALALGCVAGLVHTASVVGLHIPFDPNEGWNAYFAQRAMQTGSPYPPDGGFMVNNYPPLSFFVIGSLAHTLRFGDRRCRPGDGLRSHAGHLRGVALRRVYFAH
jgi:hypothetical protein